MTLKTRMSHDRDPNAATNRSPLRDTSRDTYAYYCMRVAWTEDQVELSDF